MYSVWECMVGQRRGGRGLARTTNGVRDSARGETNDKLRRQRTPRSKVSKVETHSLLAVVESNERNDKVF